MATTKPTGETWTTTYVLAIATVEDRLAGTVGTPAETVVTHTSGWSIRHTEGARLAEVYSPAGDLLDAVQVLAWDWTPAEGGSSRAETGAEASTYDLSEALAEWVAGNAEALGLPSLTP